MAKNTTTTTTPPTLLAMVQAQGGTVNAANWVAIATAWGKAQPTPMALPASAASRGWAKFAAACTQAGLQLQFANCPKSGTSYATAHPKASAHNAKGQLKPVAQLNPAARRFVALQGYAGKTAPTGKLPQVNGGGSLQGEVAYALNQGWLSLHAPKG